MYPNIKAVFSDTGLELPSIRSFVKTHENVDWLKPKLTFGEIVKQYGYPLFGKEISHAIWYARKIKSIDNDTIPVQQNTVQRATRLILQGKLTQNCELAGGQSGSSEQLSTEQSMQRDCASTIRHFRQRCF